MVPVLHEPVLLCMSKAAASVYVVLRFPVEVLRSKSRGVKPYCLVPQTLLAMQYWLSH